MPNGTVSWTAAIPWPWPSSGLFAREELAEKHLPALGISTSALRRLRYLELPTWQEVAGVARAICQGEAELANLERFWHQQAQDRHPLPDPFGALVQKLREQKGLTRREIADLFGVTGKKPARLIQSIEEEGCYSARAYPAGLAALVTREAEERDRLLKLWEERRKQFHRRHRPETRIELRLARELYGFEHKDMEEILGYTALEYQRIERGLGVLSESAHARIVQAIHRAGQRQVEALLLSKDNRDIQRAAWRGPTSVQSLVRLLAEREGGIIPLSRFLRQREGTSFWAGRLRAIAQGTELPPWPLLQRIGIACGVPDLGAVLRDWRERTRKQLQDSGCSPLGIEVRLLIAEVASTVRQFSARLGCSPSVLVRDLQRIDRGKPVKWFHVERILTAAGLSAGDRRWAQIHAWWYPTQEDW